MVKCWATAYVGEPIRLTIGLTVRTDNLWILARSYRREGFESQGIRFLWDWLGIFEDLMRAVIPGSIMEIGSRAIGLQDLS